MPNQIKAMTWSLRGAATMEEEEEEEEECHQKHLNKKGENYQGREI